MKVTELILRMFAGATTHTTADIMAALTPLGFSLEEISGGIGHLRAKRHLKVITSLPYGHEFA